MAPARRRSRNNIAALVDRLTGRNPRVQLVLFGALCTLYDIVATSIDIDSLLIQILEDSAVAKVFVNAALLVCIFLNVRWAMILFCALAIGYVSVILMTLPWEIFTDPSAPHLAITSILALYAAMAVILVLLTSRALKAVGKG